MPKKNKYPLDLYFENVDSKPHVVSDEWLRRFCGDEDGICESAFDAYCSACEKDVIVGTYGECSKCGNTATLGIEFSTNLAWPVSVDWHDSDEPGIGLLSYAIEDTGYALLHDANEGTYYLTRTDRHCHGFWGLALAYMRLHQFPPASITLSFDDVRPFESRTDPRWIWVAEGLYKSKMGLLNRLAYQAEDVAKLITLCKEA